MKPTYLKPGDLVIMHGRKMVFLRRDKEGAADHRNVFQCGDFAGLDGAGDRGLCTSSDFTVRWHCHRAPANEDGKNGKNGNDGREGA
jgi:hypothetical protein